MEMEKKKIRKNIPNKVYSNFVCSSTFGLLIFVSTLNEHPHLFVAEIKTNDYTLWLKHKCKLNVAICLAKAIG